jgi:hypothetical protein
MQDTDFLVAVREKRANQFERHGIQPRHSVPRWALIINGEMGKLNHALEDLTRVLDYPDSKKVADLRIKAAEQVYETTACMLAMLQESPVFNPDMEDGNLTHRNTG